jgi:hypothetical protein
MYLYVAINDWGHPDGGAGKRELMSSVPKSKKNDTAAHHPDLGASQIEARQDRTGNQWP